MITYAIVVAKSRDTRTNPTKYTPVSPTDKNYKQVMLARHLNRCYLKSGDTVRQKGSQKTGAVLAVLGDAKECAWKNDIPYFVRVKWHGDSHNTLCPYKLLKKVN